jgi:hypothetical protein
MPTERNATTFFHAPAITLVARGEGKSKRLRLA